MKHIASQCIVIVALLLSVFAPLTARSDDDVFAEKSWTVRFEPAVAIIGMDLSSDPPSEKVPLPLPWGQVVVGLNLDYVSIEYGIGGPIFLQSIGVRVLPLSHDEPSTFYFGAHYALNLGGLDPAQFILADMGYQYVGSGGFTFTGGLGLIGVLSWFKSDPTWPVGFALRLGVGYSF